MHDHLPQHGRDRVEEAREGLLVELVGEARILGVGALEDHVAEPRLQQPCLREEAERVLAHVELADVDALHREAGQLEEELHDVRALQLDAALHYRRIAWAEMWGGEERGEERGEAGRA